MWLLPNQSEAGSLPLEIPTTPESRGADFNVEIGDGVDIIFNLTDSNAVDFGAVDRWPICRAVIHLLSRSC
jgi:hypothetical protein